MSELTTPVKIDIPGLGSIESPDLYLKCEVDKLLAEKDKKIAELQAKVTLASLAEDCSNLRNKRCNYCSALLQEMQEIRRLKRSLWLMTAEWADGMGLASCNIAIKLSNKERFFYHDEANREKDIKKYRHRQVVFYKYGEYCRAKAEQCK